jgi:hypothetical protein
MHTNTNTVEVAIRPLLITVEEDDLDPDTLKEEGRAAALREAAIATFYEVLHGGHIEIEAVGTIACSGTYEGHPGYVGGVCNRCGDFSNSDPGLPCGRILDGEGV